MPDTLGTEAVIRLGCFFGVFAAMAVWEMLAPRRTLQAGKPLRWGSNLGLVAMNSLLVRVNRDATDVEPDLAESWDISPDGLTYTFHLREGLMFSDGSPLKASDAKFSLERLRDAEGSVMAGMFSVMKSVEAPDDRTVVVTLNQPSAPFLAAMAMFAAAVLPEAAVSAAGEGFGNNPVGAGAFSAHGQAGVVGACRAGPDKHRV